jgi:hypothetical protein
MHSHANHMLACLPGTVLPQKHCSVVVFFFAALGERQQHRNVRNHEPECKDKRPKDCKTEKP